MKKENIAIILGLVVFSITIAYKLNSTKERAFNEENGKLHLHEPYFKTYIEKPYKSRINSLTNFIVFLDAERVCNANLLEGPTWVEPLFSYDQLSYNLLIFLPEDMKEENISSFLEYLGISEEHVLKYKRHSAIAKLNPTGVTKFFHTAEHGVHWVEFGNTDEITHKKLKDRLAQSIEDALKGYKNN